MAVVTYDQDRINKLTEYILSDEKLRKLVTQEDWESLFHEIVDQMYGGRAAIREIFKEVYGRFGFLYHYFLELDDFNILKCISTIPSYAFYGDRKLEKIVIPDNIDTINGSSFSNCILKEIDISKNVNSIGGYAFAYSDIESIEIPEGIDTIIGGTFSHSDLVEITLPSSIHMMADYVFESCEKLKIIKFKGTLAQFQSIKVTSKTFFHSNTPITIICDDETVQINV